ncbi:MAG: hypothetical protein ACRC92_07255 [Peptostreptococcaceae bacterium]
MLNIKIVYLYPNITEIYGESNLIRIIDFNVKETIIVYYAKRDNIYEINLINTMTGNIVNVLKFKEKSDVEELIELIKSNENEIIQLGELESIEIYILNLYKN